MRVLVVEDDERTASFISEGFTQAGFSVDCAYGGEEGLDLLLTDKYDAAVIDIMLPELDGLHVISEIRRQEISTPVVILSAKRSVDDRIKGLMTGSDDYLIKPFSFSELLARVKSLIRRASGVALTSSLTVGDLSLDLRTREVIRGGKKIKLQPKEFSLLEYLVQNQGEVLLKNTILEHLWGYDFDSRTNVVDVLVCRLRSKVESGFEEKLIHTVRGVGYVLKVP